MAITKTISFRCPDELLEKLNTLSNDNNIERTTLMVQILERGIDTWNERNNEFITRQQFAQVIEQFQNDTLALQRQINDLRSELRKK